MDIERYSEIINNLKGKKNFIKQKIKEKEEEIIKNNKDIKIYEEAQTILQVVAQETQEQLKYHVNDIVQLSLDTVFPNEYSFDLQFEIKRGKTEAKLCFVQNGEEIDPLNADGGGIVDLATLGLRISSWTLSKTRNVIILDEPFKHLSDDLQPYGAAVLKELSKQLDLQFIIVTHRKELTNIADKIFEVNRIKDGEYSVSHIKVENNIIN